MATYVIGDLQGCCDPLEALLATLDFSPSRDRLYLLGDLVNRGPASLAVLRRLSGLGQEARCLLGNHDLHLLAVAEGARPPHRKDTLDDILRAPDRARWLDWLRAQHLALHEHGWLMVHAGVAPQWDLARTLALATEVRDLLRGPQGPAFLQVMYGNEPDRWDDALLDDAHQVARWRFTVNVLTRIRFCTPDGRLDFQGKHGPDAAPPGTVPWFEVPGRQTADVPIAFGHWSTLGLINQPRLLAIDTGCVWGGALTAVRIDGGRRDVVQVPCAQARRPGGT